MNTGKVEHFLFAWDEKVLKSNVVDRSIWRTVMSFSEMVNRSVNIQSSCHIYIFLLKRTFERILLFTHMKTRNLPLQLATAIGYFYKQGFKISITSKYTFPFKVTNRDFPQVSVINSSNS